MKQQKTTKVINVVHILEFPASPFSKQTGPICRDVILRVFQFFVFFFVAVVFVLFLLFVYFPCIKLSLVYFLIISPRICSLDNSLHVSTNCVTAFINRSTYIRINHLLSLLCKSTNFMRGVWQ